jgi:hypothetical protein
MNLRHAFVIPLVCALCGCAGTGISKIFHPGPAEFQRDEAETFDPFPMTDVAPEMGGARPLGYMRPASETERAQNEGSFESRFGQPAPPGTFRAPRTPFGRQQIQYVPGPPPAGAAPAFNPPAAAPPLFGSPPVVQPGFAPPFVPQ